MELFNLRGAVAIVTGSSRGIGRAIAERLAEHGARVVISSRKADSCEKVAGEINQRFGTEKAIAIAANISSRDQLEMLVDRTHTAFGQISMLVCNAATNPYYGPMSGIQDEQFRKVLENNVIATHWLIQMAVPEMRAAANGSIIVVSSIAGLRGSATLGAYGISKAADMQLVRNLAVELGPHNIRVNCIAPGLIKTDFSRALWDGDVSGPDAGLIPLKRLGEPDDIAGVAVCLAAPAGRFITGQALVVDGGATIA